MLKTEDQNYRMTSKVQSEKENGLNWHSLYTRILYMSGIHGDPYPKIWISIYIADCTTMPTLMERIPYNSYI